MRPKGTSAELEQRRRHAVAMLKRGMKAAVIARGVGRGTRSLRVEHFGSDRVPLRVP